MREIALQCRAATMFAKDGSIDEDAFRASLQRLTGNGIDVYLASAGSGEGHSLSWHELRRVYAIGAAACRGKVQANANPPEQNNARMTIEHAKLAIEAGVDVVNIYQPAAWHGYRPHGDELRAYYDMILREISHPVALAPNPMIGRGPTPLEVAELCKKFSQIVSINLVGQNELYFLELRAALNRDVRLFVDTQGLPNTLVKGAAGLVGGNLNIMPESYRAYADAFAGSDLEAMAELFSQMVRTNAFTKRWANPGSRVVKMFMAVFKLPGWQGGLREPCRMPPAQELEEFHAGLMRLDVPEFSRLGARVAS